MRIIGSANRHAGPVSLAAAANRVIDSDAAQTSRFSLAALMQGVAVERTGSDRPSLFHTGARAGQRGLLSGRQNKLAANRSQPRDRLAIAGDYEFGTDRDAYCFCHLGALGTFGR
jgi:hypothetical protein